MKRLLVPMLPLWALPVSALEVAGVNIADKFNLKKGMLGQAL